MQVSILKSKIHKATVTFSDLYYEGSLAIDQDLMDAAGIFPYERLLVVNTNNGARLETYAIVAPRGSRVIGLNGAAARRGAKGDRLTIMSFGSVEAGDAARVQPTVIILDEENTVVRRKGDA